MKQLNKCPNCGALLPKSRTNTIVCEYCGGEFVNPNPVIVIGEVDVEELRKIDKTVRVMPFGKDEIARLENGMPATSTTVANYYPERDENGGLAPARHDDSADALRYGVMASRNKDTMPVLSYHFNAPVHREHIQLDSGHTVTHFGNNYIVHANSPKDSMKDLMAEMKEAVLKRDNITMPRGVNPFVKSMEFPNFELPDNGKEQWKVRCFPW